MKKVIIICSQYPPMKHVASQRHYAFASYLSKYGYKVTVITDQLDNNYDDINNDINILRIPAVKKITYYGQSLHDNSVVHNIKTLINVLINQLVIDDTKSWAENAYKIACNLIENDNYNVVLSSYAPIRTHLVALRLKRRFEKLLWIADMRDELASDPALPVAYRNYNPLFAHNERLILNNADVISSVSKPLLDKLKKRCTNPNCEFIEIRNGYDFDIKNDDEKNSKFTITYAGSMAGRDPGSFLTACEELVVSGTITDLIIQFIGVEKNIIIPQSLKNIVKIIPSVPYLESVNYMQSSDLLFLIIAPNNRKGVYTGKLFDYLGALKPILAMIPPDDVAAELIRVTNSGYVIDYNNTELIKQYILEVYDNWRKGIAFIPNISLIEEHHRKNQTLKLANVIENFEIV